MVTDSFIVEKINISFVRPVYNVKQEQVKQEVEN